MKITKILLLFGLTMVLLLSTNSCAVVSNNKSMISTKDNGKHKGWFKNTKNPHNPRSTNSGKKKGRK